MGKPITIRGKVNVKDGIWQAIRAKVKGLDKKYIKVGILSNKGGEERTNDGEFSMVELGAVHEFGSEKAGIPERSWLRRTFEEKRDLVADMVSGITKDVILDKITVRRGLEKLGLFCSIETKKTITAGDSIPPPLAARTIARKGSDRALVDTGHFVGSITYEVVE